MSSPDVRQPDEEGGRTPPPEQRLIAPADESPSVPGFRTWRGVYAFVFAVFVLVVILLSFFTRYFA